MRINQMSPISNNISVDMPQLGNSGSDRPIVTSDTVKFKVKPFGKTSSSEDIPIPGVKSSGDAVNEEIIQQSIAQANKSLSKHHRTIQRSVHEVTKAVMYTIKDTDTNEVIAEFPPKRIQDMIAKMWELAGLVVDEKA